jgi:hypothetical protein
VELVSIILRLWRLKFMVAIAAVLAAVLAASTIYHLPSGKPRSITFASASTQILIDAPNAPLASSTTNLDAFTSRAAVYARLMTSDPVRAAIARAIGVNTTKITADSPVDPDGAPQAVEPGSERRAGELAAETLTYRLYFQAEQSLPIVAVYAQAPTPKEAEKLANSTPAALQSVLSVEQNASAVPKNARVEIKQLGRATGAWVNQGAGKSIAVLVFLVTFCFLCFLLLVASRFRELWRMVRAAEPVGPETDGVEGELDDELDPDAAVSQGPPSGAVSAKLKPRARKRAAKRAAKNAPADAGKPGGKRAAKRAAKAAAAAAPELNGHANGNGNGHVDGQVNGNGNGAGHADGPSTETHELTHP